jgi:hypothetical protein
MKSPDKSKELQVILKQELGENQARLTLLSYLIISLLKIRRVNFKCWATIHNGAQLYSKLRRVQMFFRQFTFSESFFAD